MIIILAVTIIIVIIIIIIIIIIIVIIIIITICIWHIGYLLHWIWQICDIWQICYNPLSFLISMFSKMSLIKQN